MPKRSNWRSVTAYGVKQDGTDPDGNKTKIDNALRVNDHVLFPAREGALPADYAYTGTLTIPDGTSIRGDGIGVSRILAPVKTGSHCTIGGIEQQGITFGKAIGPSAHSLTDGCHDTTFSQVRFRSYNGSNVFNMSDYIAWRREYPAGSGIWIPTTPTAYPNRRCNARDVTFTDCEFEFNGRNTHQFEIWWDIRPGGGSISGFTWDGCTFGVRNKDGKYPGYSGAASAYAELLIQPSPPEHGEYGPRPGSGTNHEFDWATYVGVGHGAGTASEHTSPGRMTIKDTRFVGLCSLASFDLCDNIRSYIICTTKNPDGTWKYNATTNGTQPERAAVPSYYGTNEGWDFDNVWFADSFIAELGRDNAEWDATGEEKEGSPLVLRSGDWIYPDHLGDGTGYGDLRYYVTAEVEGHDLELYPNLTSIRVDE